MDNYLITDGTRYISKRKNGQYVAEDNDDKALVLPRNEAEKVLKNKEGYRMVSQKTIFPGNGYDGFYIAVIERD